MPIIPPSAGDRINRIKTEIILFNPQNIAGLGYTDYQNYKKAGPSLVNPECCGSGSGSGNGSGGGGFGETTLSRGEWAEAFLKANRWPVTHNNLVALVGWMEGEGSPCKCNPLDTTVPVNGATDCNRVGVKNFLTYADGINATSITLKGNFRDYKEIRDNLAASSSPIVTATSIANSPWGTGRLALECITDAANSIAKYNLYANRPVVQ